MRSYLNNGIRLLCFVLGCICICIIYASRYTTMCCNKCIELFDYFEENHHHHHHHHHHVVALARIFLTVSHPFSLSLIASGRSSRLHLVSPHSCCMYVRAGRPAFARPYAGVHKSTSLMSSSLLLQLCPACLVLLTWIVFVMGGKWPYCWCLVGCCRHDLFNIARNMRPSSASTRHYRHDRCLEETAFHFIRQVWFPYDR